VFFGLRYDFMMDALMPCAEGIPIVYCFMLD